MLESFYKSYYNYVYKYLKKHMWSYINECEIDEIIIRSFIAFDQKHYNLDSFNNVEQVLCKFAYNKMRNISMYNKRYYYSNLELHDYHYNYLVKKDILEFLIIKEKNELIKKTINSLSPMDKNIILMRFYYNLKYKEIALIVNIKYRLIGKKMKEILNTLKERLKKLNYDFKN